MVRIVFIGGKNIFRLNYLNKIENCIIDVIDINNKSINYLPKDVIDLFIVECYNIDISNNICKNIKNNYLLNHIPLICLTDNINSNIDYCDIIISDNTSDIEYIYQVKTLIKMKLMDDELKKEKIILELKVQERTLELEEKAEKLKITLNSIGDGVIVTDQNGYVTSMNPIAMELTELSRNDYYHKHIDKILKIETDGQKINIFDNVINSNKTFFIKNGSILYSKQGKKIRISDSVSKIINKDGDLNGIVIVFSDITSEYDMRNKIIDSEKKYRRIFYHIPDVVYTMDINGNFKSLNDASIFGYENSDVIGKNIIEFLPYDDDLKIIKNNIQLKLKGDKKITMYEIHLKQKNGSIIPIEVKSQMIFDNDNKPVEIFGIVRDITYKKIIQEEQERYKNIFDNMDSGVGVFKTNDGHNFYFIGFNNRAKEMEKLSDEDVLNKEIYDVFPEFEKNNFKKHLKNVWLNGKSITIDDFYYESNKTGVKGWRKFFIYKLTTSNEIVVIGDDITDIHEYQNKLKFEKERAENSDKLKSIFLANMSHEIRTPLNAIIGFSSQINENTDHKNLNDYIKIIHNSGNLLLRLIDDILELSKLEVGDLRIINEYFNLNELILESRQEYVSLSKSKNKEHINIKIDIPDDDIFIYTDQKRLKQVINNLVYNSLKFTNNGYIKYGFNINKDVINFYVQDTGIGISKENINKIFDRFIQIENKSYKKQEGTGLGLTISKAIIELLGGNIWVTSELNKGTIFYFTIPYIKNEKNQQTEHTSIIKQPDKVKFYNWSNKKMIIIDDNDVNFKLYKIVMEYTKINILRCLNGNDFKKIFDTVNPDIILLNLHLTDYHACDIIKYIKNKNNIPIIVTTTVADKNDEQSVLDCGANFFIYKPINWNLLKEKIDELMFK